MLAAQRNKQFPCRDAAGIGGNTAYFTFRKADDPPAGDLCNIADSKHSDRQFCTGPGCLFAIIEVMFGFSDDLIVLMPLTGQKDNIARLSQANG